MAAADTVVVAVDLTDLIEDLQTELSAPGSDNFPDATTAEWLSNLRNAFWEARLQGVITGYTESDGLVSPLSGSTDMGRDQQQVIILFAAYRIVLANLRAVSTGFRAKAGPVEFETSSSSMVLRDVLAAIKDKIKLALATSSFSTTDTAYIDAVMSRTEAIAFGDTWYLG